MKQDLSQRLIKDLENFDTISGIELQKSLVQWLDKEVPYYNWTGFYFMNDEKQQLEIGPMLGRTRTIRSSLMEEVSAAKLR